MQPEKQQPVFRKVEEDGRKNGVKFILMESIVDFEERRWKWGKGEGNSQP
jgi:hypothetical protein